LKCSVRLLEKYFKLDSSFIMTFMFQGWLSVSWWWWTFRATKHQQNDRICWRNSRTHPWRPSRNNPWAHRHRWDRLWNLPGDLNKIWTCIALLLHHDNVPAHTSLKTTEFYD
jgi:hypothetical protein